MSEKLKKKFFMKPNNLQIFCKFFYSIKNIYFPDILRILNKKKTFYIFRKKNHEPRCFDIRENFLFKIAI